jgi:hypothetical protein
LLEGLDDEDIRTCKGEWENVTRFPWSARLAAEALKMNG